MTGRVLVVAVAPAVDRYHWVTTLTPGTVNRPLRAEQHSGGKALNAARVMRRLGTPVTAIVPVAERDTASFLGPLVDRAIEPVAVPVSAEMRHTVTVIEEATGRATELYEPSPPLAADEWAALGRAAATAMTPDLAAVVVSGTRRGDEEAIGGFVATVLDAAAGRGLPVYLDALTPLVVPALRWAGDTTVVVKVNVAAAIEILDALDAGSDPAAAPPHDEATGALAAELVRRGAGAAVVTGGERAGALAEPGGTVAIPAPTRLGKFPGGSGGSLLAGLVVGAARTGSLAAALDLARECAERNADDPIAGGR